MILLLYDKTTAISDNCWKEITILSEKMGKQCAQNEISAIDDIPAQCETQAVDLLFLSVPSSSRLLQKYLNVCRQLRIPYIFLTNKITVPLHFSRVLLPVGFLEEEIGKAQYASAFGRFCNAEIVLFQANDYGSRAQINTNKIRTLFDKFSLQYTQVKAKKDSFKVEIEAAMRASEWAADLLIISSSRDYGLDDLLFGPKERHVIGKSTVPVMLINPRKDLYTLCD